MQKVVERPKKEDRAPKQNVIAPPKFMVIAVPIKNALGSPLVVHAFSQKARETMRAKQEMGGVAKKGRARDPKNFAELFEQAKHVSRDGWEGVAAAAFRGAMISACRLVGFKMTIGKLSVFIESDGVSRLDGTPLVRIHGEAMQFESMVRNETGMADIRVRPRYDEWSALVRVRFDREQFSEDDVVNLIVRAGTQVGICEGRPDSSQSYGQGWGLFEIDTTKPISLTEIVAPKIEFVRG